MEKSLQKLDQQVRLIVQILEEQERRGWMSGEPNAFKADAKIKELLEQLKKTLR